MIPKTANVVIIGSGAMGASTAYHLAKMGVKDIVILEKEEVPGGHTTSRCAGGFRHQFSTKINVLLSKLSIEKIRYLQEELNYNFDINYCGYVFLLTENDDLSFFKNAVKMQNELNVNTQWLELNEIKEMLPMMRIDDVIAATYYEYDGLMEPSSLVNAYLSEAEKMGVKIFTGETVIGIDTKDNKIEGIATISGKISTPIVVNAAGPWAGEIGKLVNVNIPIKPVMQQLFFTSKIEWVSNSFPVVIFPYEGLGFHKEGDGLLTGMTKPPVKDNCFELMIDEEWELLHCEKAIQRIPDIENTYIRSRWAGFYEETEDDHPIVGSIPGIDGFYCIAGFNGHGFMQSPICGQLLAEEIIYGKARSLDIEILRVERFYNGKCTYTESFKI
ncbi:NAD(P)/FAD-dependent oxidoreductase [Acetivibrio mesophilus]|uniref:FAD-binding oxidoreductase n=1 Tax=Acetivibrio mesophilus TaxID=2487273 RepID=A0A4Q0I8K2_9FIRM|nr:FAD-binding oxidoreductase [Acetivibrio mesophilus]ODM26237.1 hypothetical protein A7W90_08370 [Clostridium sp. Bc-iso-3]RXE60710.1 FAD-binding oxidoreductase [Acetivibrio mesophilus]HHV28123.1 FAD-binding oxidoreductase [Clostridium sp.]